MGQIEVYDFLKKNPRKWFTSKEIADCLKTSVGSTTTSLKKVRKNFREIIFRQEENDKNHKFLYKYGGVKV